MGKTKGRAENDNYIDIKPGHIDYAFTAKYRKEPSGLYSWYIPSFDIYFSSSSHEDGEKRSKALTFSFFNYWIQNEGFEAFLNKLERLGFTPDSKKQAKALIKSRRKNVVFMHERPVKPSEDIKDASIYKSIERIRA